jgi:hypothetical protein
VLGLDASTRRAWLAVQAALDGLPLDEAQASVFRAHTGRDAPRSGGYQHALILCGRQAGKTEQATARLVYEAASASLAGARGVSCIGLAQDHRAAQRVLFGYVRRFVEAPLLAPLVEGATDDAITLRGGVRVAVLPCRPAAIRGLRCRCVVLDEVAFFRSTEQVPLDREAWRAALATVLTTSGKVLAFSSPYGSSGLAWDLHREHYGKPTDLLVWQSASYILHPGLSEAALARLRELDPEGAEAEIEGGFLRGLSLLLDVEAVDAVTDHGTRERAPVLNVRPGPGPRYVAHYDPSGGRPRPLPDARFPPGARGKPTWSCWTS